MKTLLTALALFGIFATPAFAQSACNCNGADSVVSLGDNPVVIQSQKIAARPHGLNSFAMAPKTTTESNSNGPAATGGGSLGYNEMLGIY
jgi:hypothetical protein